MKPELISTSSIVKLFTEDEIKRSGLWEITGADGHQGWAMKQTTKKLLKNMGHVPTNRDGDDSKRCTLWHKSAVEDLTILMKEALSNELEEEDVGVGLSKEDVIIDLLQKIIKNQETLLEKWN